MLDVVIEQRVQEAENIISLDLVPAQAGILPVFTPGAHIDLHLPDGLVRQYSLCHPGDGPTPKKYTIAVQREKESRGGSAAVHEKLQVGSRLRISEPRNLFALDATAERHLLIAGGIGITPLICMAQALASRGQEFELHYFSQSQARMAFLDLLGLDHLAPSVHVHIGRDAGAVLAELLKVPGQNTHVYVCGPAGFMECALDTAGKMGWPAAHLHKEFFAASAPKKEGEQAFEVQIARTGNRYEIPIGRSVFEVLEEAGFDIPVSCEQGICGTCVTRVIDGIPDHRDQYLTDAEKAANNCFTPCCSRALSPLLVLDV